MFTWLIDWLIDCLTSSYKYYMHIQDRPYTTIHMYIKIEHNRGGEGRPGEMPLATTGKVWRAEGGGEGRPGKCLWLQLVKYGEPRGEGRPGEMPLATTDKVWRAEGGMKTVGNASGYHW